MVAACIAAPGPSDRVGAVHRARPRRHPALRHRRWAGAIALGALTVAACGTPGTSTDDDAGPTTTAPSTENTSSSTPPSPSSSTAAATSQPPTTINDGTPETQAGSAVDAPCTVEAVPAVAGFDPFYVQGCNLAGFWVVAGAEVDPAAVTAAAALAHAFLGPDPVLTRAVLDSGVRLGVIGADQQVTDMPEYRDLPEAFPDIDWDARARGLGATAARPLVSAGEENLLCLDGDRYRGDDILLHEFAHTLHRQGLAVVEPDFDATLEEAYDAAIAGGTWTNTYAATNPEEYWAEGVQSYFDRNLSAEVADGFHGPIDTRQELADADPTLFALIDERFGAVRLPPSCQDPP